MSPKCMFYTCSYLFVLLSELERGVRVVVRCISVLQWKDHSMNVECNVNIQVGIKLFD